MNGTEMPDLTYHMADCGRDETSIPPKPCDCGDLDEDDCDLCGHTLHTESGWRSGTGCDTCPECDEATE